MKNIRNRIKAFTLAEIMIAVLVIGIIAAATIGVQKSRTNYANKFMYYAALKNIQDFVVEMQAEGTIVPGTPASTQDGDGTESNTILYFPGYEQVIITYNTLYDRYDYYVNHKSDPGWDELYAQGSYKSAKFDYETALANTRVLYEGVYVKMADKRVGGWPTIRYPYEDEDCIYGAILSTTGDGGTTTPATPDTVVKALPGSAAALCAKTIELLNTAGIASVATCAKTTNDAGPFTPENVNFTTTNGMRWFNFGTAYNYIGDKTVQADKDADYANQLYTIYIDIDGSSKGKNELNSDIMKFYITRDGTILPAQDSVGANDKKYISASVRYKNGTKYVAQLQGVTYREASCKSGKVPAAFNTKLGYCNGIASDATTTKCATAGINCEVYNNKPGF